jgi:hypothetical protein
MKPGKHNPDSSSIKEVSISVPPSPIKPHQPIILASLSTLLVIFVYVWFISFGLGTDWPAVSNYEGYYDQLAIAFRNGHLSLDIQPSPAVLALHNPYDPAARQSNNVVYPIDFSLYKGKYYLYFGPVPALLLMVAKLLGVGTTYDLYFVFAFASGMLIFQSLLIIKLWGLYFQNVPSWAIPLCILFCGLISPIPWILTDARVYEAASAGGQFFFLAGLYFAVNALERSSIPIGDYLIAGILWTLAIGTRLTQIIPVGFMVVMVVFWIVRAYFRSKPSSKPLYSLVFLCLPLALGLAILGWYNWARFNSVFETGFYYELAGPFLQKYSRVLFSPLYLFPNLFNYLVMRPKIGMTFPFIQSASGYGDIKFSFINLPAIYHEGGITGVLFSTPFAIFAAIPVLSPLLRRKETEDQVDAVHGTDLFKWVIISLLGSFLFGFAPIVLYFFVETRFVADFISALILLSIAGFWQGYGSLRHKIMISKLYVVLGIILMATSVIISVLLALSAHAEQFQQFNPMLWDHLVSLFSR